MERKFLFLLQCHSTIVLLHPAQPVEKFSFCLSMLIELHKGAQFSSQPAHLTYVWYVPGDEICYWALWCCSAAKESHNVWLQFEFTIAKSNFWKRKHFPEFQSSEGKKKKPTNQLDIAWEEHSRKRMHIEAFEKNMTEKDCSIKRLLTWKDACLIFLKAESVLRPQRCNMAGKTTAFLLQLCWCQDGVSPSAAIRVSSIFHKGLASCRTPLNSAACAAVRAWAAALLPVKRGLGGFCCSAVLS